MIGVVQFAEIESAIETHGTAEIRREIAATRWQILGARSHRRYALARPNLSARPTMNPAATKALRSRDFRPTRRGHLMPGEPSYWDGEGLISTTRCFIRGWSL